MRAVGLEIVVCVPGSLNERKGQHLWDAIRMLQNRLAPGGGIVATDANATELAHVLERLAHLLPAD